MKFALIYENEVMNRFECENYELANVLARASFGDEAFAVCTDRYATIMGDKYIDGIFFREESLAEEESEKENYKVKYVEVPYIPTEKDMIDDLKNRLLQSQLVLTDTYEEKLELENKLTELQRAVTEINERIGGKI